MPGPEIMWNTSARWIDAPEHPVRRWTADEARSHLERRIGEIQARQDELRDEPDAA